MADIDFSQYTLAQEHEDIFIESRTDAKNAVSRLIEIANHSLYILSPDLDTALLSHQKIIDNMSQLVRKDPHNFIYILVHDTEHAVKHDNMIIGLSQRLSSYIQIRKMHSDYKDIIQAYIIADKRALYHRKIYSLYEGQVNFNNPLFCKECIDQFEEIWQRSETDIQTRRLYI